MAAKGLLIIIVTALIFSCSQIYAAAPDSPTIKTEVDRLIVKMQDTMSGRGDSKVVKETANELILLGEAAVPYLLDRIKETCQRAEDIDSAGSMLMAEGYCLRKMGNLAAPYLIEAFEDRSAGNILRCLLLDLIGPTRDKRTLGPLMKVLADRNEDISLRRRAAFILGSCRTHKCVEALIGVLSEDDDILRMRAAESLGKMGSKEAVPYLVKMLKDKNRSVRRFTAEALGKIGDKSAVEPLIPLLNDSDGLVRSWTAKALGRLKDSRAIEPLRNTLKDKYSSVKSEAMIALGKLGDEEGFRMLIDALRTTRGEEQWRIISALGETGNKEARGPLKEQLKIKEGVDSKTAYLIDLSLAILGDQEGFDKAIKYLDNPGREAKISTIKVLGELGSEAAIEKLTELLDDMDATVRSEAEKALDRIRNNE